MSFSGYWTAFFDREIYAQSPQYAGFLACPLGAKLENQFNVALLDKDAICSLLENAEAYSPE